MLKINTYNCFQTLESRLDWPHDSVSQQLCGMLRIVKKKKKIQYQVQNYKIYLQ